jgi:type II secretory pathway component PulM
MGPVEDETETTPSTSKLKSLLTNKKVLIGAGAAVVVVVLYTKFKNPTITMNASEFQSALTDPELLASAAAIEAIKSK